MTVDRVQMMTGDREEDIHLLLSPKIHKNTALNLTLKNIHTINDL